MVDAWDILVPENANSRSPRCGFYGMHGTYWFLKMQILVPQDADFMAYILIEYNLNDGNRWHMANMTAVGSSLYIFTFANF